jgi:hypothetical protein
MGNLGHEHPRMTNDADEAIKSIDEFNKLNCRNWDGYDGDPIRPETVDRAKALVEGLRGLDCMHFNPAPGGDGSIGFEICWRDGRELWIDVNPDGRLSAYIPNLSAWLA